uniref:Uncharacterized protein n=1 Tax=Fundidesulfovibrio putealis TaxID=270496 RepID=A0A7C4AHJ9_9BACT
MYVWLAPRLVTMFPEVALDGAGSLVTPGPAARRAARERWRLLGVMALIWTPEHFLNALSRIGDSLHWWDDPLVGWAFSLAHYVFGFLTLLVSAAAGAVMYARLSVDEAVSLSS